MLIYQVGSLLWLHQRKGATLRLVMSQTWLKSPRNLYVRYTVRTLKQLTAKKMCILTTKEESKTGWTGSSEHQRTHMGLPITRSWSGPALREGSSDQKDSTGTYIVNICRGADRVCERIM